MSRRADRLTLAQVRSVLAARGGGGYGEKAFQLYVALFVIVIVVIPVARFLVLMLAAPPVVAVLTADSTPALVVLGAIALVLLAASLGGVRGAVVPRPAYVQLVVRGPMQQRVTLHRPLLVVQLVTVTGFIAVTDLVCWGLTVAGHPLAVPTVTLFLAVAGGYTVLLVTAWLAGQVSRGIRVLSAVALVALLSAAAAGAAADAVGPTLASIGQMSVRLTTAVSTTAGLAWAGITVTVAVSVVLAAVSSALLDRLRSTELMTQGQTWAAAGILAVTGDVRGSADRLRMPARHTPSRVGLRAGPIWWLIVKRDAVGAVRHPARLAAGIAAGILAGVLVAAALAIAPGAGAVLAATAGVFGYLCAGCVSDGVRSHADNIGAPALFGIGPQALTLLHLVLPALITCVVMTVGAILAVAWLHLAAPVAMLAAAVLGAILAQLRGVSAVKGPLPIVLLMPVNTPGGDVSILFALAWAFDATLLALVIGVGVVWLAGTTSVAAFLSGAVATVTVLAIWGGRRLQQLRPGRS